MNLFYSRLVQTNKLIIKTNRLSKVLNSILKNSFKNYILAAEKLLFRERKLNE